MLYSVLLLSHIFYALPAWGGFLCHDLVAKFNAFFQKKAVRWGYSSELRRLSVLLHEADAQLFRKMINNKEHCIHQLLPPEKILPMKLRASNCILHCHNVIITYTSVRLYCVAYLKMLISIVCKSAVALFQ